MRGEGVCQEVRHLVAGLHIVRTSDADKGIRGTSESHTITVCNVCMYMYIVHTVNSLNQNPVNRNFKK